MRQRPPPPPTTGTESNTMNYSTDSGERPGNVSSAGKVARLPQIVAHLLTIRFCEVQQSGGRTTDRCQWVYSPPIGAEVVGPVVSPRIVMTSALMSETNRSTSHISSNSASSSGVNTPCWLRPRSSCARAAAGPVGRNCRISLAVGWRARKEITSRRRLEVPDQPRRNPRAIISPRRSRSGSNCWASLSGISMVNRMIQRLTQSAEPVKSRGEPVPDDFKGRQQSGMALHKQICVSVYKS